MINTLFSEISELDITATIVAIITLLVLDILWISQFMGPRYSTMVNDIQGSPLSLNQMAGALAYGLMVIGLILFVLPKVHKYGTNGLLFAALFGLIVYGVYDATGVAVLKDWNISLAYYDVLWGVTVYTLSSFSYLLIKGV